MSYPFDTTQLQTAQAVKTLNAPRPTRILARRTARQLRREIRGF